MMYWGQAVKMAGKLVGEASRKEGLLDRMRGIYVQANTSPNTGAGGNRPQIAIASKTIETM